MNILIKNGRVVDPANQRNQICDILVAGAKIAKIGRQLKDAGARVIEATGKIVMPGLVDMHVHLREPGREDQETIFSATSAALKGGVTSVLAMPNTNPAMDSPANISLLQSRIKQSVQVNVLISGTITKGRKGQQLTDIAALKKKGAVVITDDGASVDNEKLLLAALKTAQKNKLLTICHCEDKALSAGGSVNLGIISTRMGLPGISKESEYQRVQRDIQLAQKAKARIHIAHVSCQQSVEIIARAKKNKIRVTAETAPHYFALTQEAVTGFDTNLKMNPPLRSAEDVQAIKQGLRDGTIDAIASDHAPHTESEKDIEFERANFGVIGLETELAVSISELVHSGLLNWSQLIEKLAVNPAKILGINKASLAVGADADIVILAPEKKWRVKPQNFACQSGNSAFIGKTLTGLVEYTIYKGKVAYQAQ